VRDRLHNNPEEAQYIAMVIDNVNNTNEGEDGIDIQSIEDAEDWEDVELFDIPEDDYPDDPDDDPDDPDDPNSDPFKHLLEVEREIVNEFRSICLLDNPLSHMKVKMLLSVIKRLSVFKFPSYSKLFSSKYKAQFRELKYNPTNAPGSLTECRYVHIQIIVNIIKLCITTRVFVWYDL